MAMPGSEATDPFIGPWTARRWLYLMVGLFFVAALVATTLNYANFWAQNEYDLSINQQALATTLHGNIPFPFYSAANCGRTARCSLLLVHPVLIGYPLAAVYGLAPTAFTLLTVQSLALAVAALPLYGLAVVVTRSPKVGLVTAGTYLAWTPLFVGMFSFHWEAFIPAEYFALFYLWTTRRYLLAIPVVLAAFVTLELMPVLVFCAGLFFLYPWGSRVAGVVLSPFREWLHEEEPRPDLARRTWAMIREGLRSREMVASLGLLIASVAAYLLLHEFVQHQGWGLGLPPLPPTFKLGVSQPIKAFSFTLGSLGNAWFGKLTYWLVTFASLGFIPVFAPRAYLVMVPWIGFTLFGIGAGLHGFGNHYAFPAAAVLFIGFAYGLARLARWAEWIGPRAPVARGRLRRRKVPALPPAEGSAGDPAATPSAPTAIVLVRRRPPWYRRPAGAALTAVLVFVFASNLFLNPLNPATTGLVASLGPPFPSGYGVDYSMPTGFEHLESLVALIPSNAVVAAPLPLFSLVADDPYAYPIVGLMNNSYLPFNSTPAFLLLNSPASGSALSTQLPWVNVSTYGVRAYVSQSPVGLVILYQANYTGAAEAIGAPFPLPASPYYPNQLVISQNGILAGVSGAPWNGQAIESRPSAFAPPWSLWAGPTVPLEPGSYEFSFLLKLMALSEGLPNSTQVVEVTLHWFPYGQTACVYPLSYFVLHTWVTLGCPVATPVPLLHLTVVGYLLSGGTTVALGQVSIVAT